MDSHAARLPAGPRRDECLSLARHWRELAVHTDKVDGKVPHR
jgi:hypothetical protein